MSNETIVDFMDKHQKQQADTRRMWLKHNLSKGMEYIDNHFKLVITPVLQSGFSIYLYPCYPNKNTSLYIHVDFKYDCCKMIDLVGNGEKSNYQNKKYGTLLVNLAIQIMRCIYDQDILVNGDISNAHDNELETNSARRHHFWKRFGFKAKNPDSYNTPMQSYLNKLKVLDRGMIQDILPTTLNLHNFYCTINRPILPKNIYSLINELDIKPFSTIDLLSYKLIEKKRSHSLIMANRLSYGAVLISLTLILYLFFPTDIEQLKWFAFFVVITLLFVPSFLRYRLIDFIPGYRQAERQNIERLNSIKSIKDEIVKLEKQQGGFVWRIYEPLTKINPKIKNDEFDEIASTSKSQYFDLIDYNYYGKMLALFKSILENNYLTTPPDYVTEAKPDFLFGTLTHGIDIKKLERFSKNLKKTHFIQHINRLLKENSQHRLIINSGNTGLYEFPALINILVDDISQVELYVYGEPDCDTPFLYIKLYLSNGILDFQTMTCVWKTQRADEMVTTLGELWRHNLINRTYINDDRDGCGLYEKKFMSNDPMIFLMDIFNMMNARWITASDLEKYQNKLNTILQQAVTHSID